MLRSAPILVVTVVIAALSACPTPADGDGAGEGEGEAAEGEGEGDAGEGEGEGGEGEGEGDVVGDVTWYRDVLPVARAKCGSCHQAGGIGHFPIDDIEQVIAHNTDIVGYVESGLMPPWMPSRDCSGHTYEGDRSLSAQEIALFTAWGAGGFVVGDPADASGTIPPAIALERVDVELQPDEVYVAGQQGGDDYHCFLLDPALPSRKFITGYDIQPGERALVHHVLLYSASRAEAQQRDAQEAGLGWTCFGGPDVGGGGLDAPQTLGAWAPGGNALQYPDGTGLALDVDQVIVMQVHYNFDNIFGPIPPDQTRVQLQLEDSVAETALLLPVPNSDFSLPPNQETTDSFSAVGAGCSVWGLMPHMHQLGTAIRFSAGQAGCLVDVPAWDFRWQQSYFFTDVDNVQLGLFEPVTLTCSWNNTTDNTVEWGENTTDEMCLIYVYATGCAITP